jgi:hypothetical protein
MRANEKKRNTVHVSKEQSRGVNFAAEPARIKLLAEVNDKEKVSSKKMLTSTLNSKSPSPSIGVKQHPQHIPDAEVNHQSIKIQMV